jgi:sulfate/thiosulfate transport system substrate-binding protein
MKLRTLATFVATLALGAGAALPAFAAAQQQQTKLLNVSYDPTRELYEEINRLFADHYKQQTGRQVAVEQSHGGSSKQARSVIDGLKADVVTLGLGWDVTAVEKAGLINAGWQQRLPYNASPYTSTIVFVVRKGNPKGIKDWNDLVRPGVQVITPNPKTSGGARWNFLAAWGYGAGVKGHDLGSEAGLKQATDAARSAKSFPAVDDPRAREFVAALYRNVPVLDTGARGATVTFAQKGVGDVLINWENEAYLAREEFGADKFEIVYPSVSILAEPPVAVVDKVVDERGTREVAEAYVKFLYTPEAQDVIGQLHYRPRSTQALQKYARELPPLPLFTIDATFGGWERAQKHYFGDGGVFDQLYTPAGAAASVGEAPGQAVPAAAK